MPNIWQKLVNDPRTHLGTNKNSTSFRFFIEDTLPVALGEVSRKICTIETLMEAQFLCVDALAQHSPKKSGALARIRQGLSQYEDADVFLFVAEMSEREYCCTRSAMTTAEYEKMMDGRLLIRDLLEKHPAVILAPILRELKTLH